MAGKGFERDREKAAYSGFPGGLWLSGSSDLESRLILFEQGSQLFVPAEPGHWAAGQRFRKIFFCQGVDGRQGIPHGVAALWCWFRNTSLMDQGCHCLAKAQQLLIVVGRLPFARAGSGDQTITDQRAEKDTCLLMCEKRHGRVYKAVAVVARASALPGQQVTLSRLVGVELAYFELRSQLAGQVDRIVVFDDSVSSLDSDILFIVSSLIKALFDEVRQGTGHIKQVFVLTHNVYFHKEVTFNARRTDRNAMRSEETFWVVRKSHHSSRVEAHTSNPIVTSYELLWAEVRRADRSNLSIQNTLRRILENYFKILGGTDTDDICNLFEGREKVICRSLFSWVNDGSHFAHDDLYVAVDDAMVESYLNIFKAIFVKSGHLAHYKMMMRKAYSDDSEIAAKTQEQQANAQGAVHA